MDLLRSSSHISAVRFTLRRSSLVPYSTRAFNVRASLPFSNHRAKYYRELEGAIDVVERACRLCVDVKSSLFSNDGRILEKNDQTPVTVADFGVQALVSLELGRRFPNIPLVAEEDSAFLRSNNLVDAVVNVVADKTSSKDKSLTEAEVLEAVDRGGKDAFTFCTKPASYWILDPIDGTRGFVKGNEALYVVGLALVVEEEITIGVMGCPNWAGDASDTSASKVPETGTIMIAHVGCGTWTKRFSYVPYVDTMLGVWTRCFVNGCHIINEASFCIPDSQTWESLPLSTMFNAIADADAKQNDQIHLLQTCCGSLCKYVMVASGRASVFIQRAKVQTSIKAWDHAVGIICVHEAGGKVSDWEGGEIDLAADQSDRRVIFPSGGMLATNGNLHDQILEMISGNLSTV